MMKGHSIPSLLLVLFSLLLLFIIQHTTSFVLVGTTSRSSKVTASSFGNNHHHHLSLSKQHHHYHHHHQSIIPTRRRILNSYYYDSSLLLRASSLSTKTTVNENDSATTTTPQNKIRRIYETFVWKYSSGFDNEIIKSTSDDTYYNINYRVEGPINGIPILLIHGFGANVNHFRYQFPALLNVTTNDNIPKYRVYAIDLIGFGASDKPIHKPGTNEQQPFGYCIEIFVQLIYDFMIYMNNKEPQQPKNSNEDDSAIILPQKQQWIIAGNSIGGLCSLCIGAKCPQYVRQIILFNCAGGMTGFRYNELPWFITPLLLFVQYILLGPILGSYFFENFRTRTNVENILIKQRVYYNPINVNSELLDILLEPSNDINAKDVFLQVFGGPPGPTPESILPLIKAPILSLWGNNDPWTPVDYGLHPGNSFNQYNNNYTLYVIPNTGHCPHDENPIAINEKMITWLESF